MFSAGFWSSPFWEDFIVPAAAFLLLFFLRTPLTRCFFHPFRKWSEKTGGKWPAEFASAFSKPMRVLFIALGILAALHLSPVLFRTGTLWPTAVKCFRSLLVILVAWGLFRISGSGELTSLFVVKKLDLNVDRVLLPFLSKALRFLVAALAVLIIAQEWNYNISGLLTGLGLGGLAFALAAKDTLSNLFGGLVILVDKPFAPGDWIKTDDVEGTVEDINFRSVKVRTFSQAVVTVPNAKLVGGAITNYSRMGKRKADITLTLHPDTTARQIQTCVQKIRAMFQTENGVEHESAIIAFNGMGEYGYRLMLYFYTETTDWYEYLKSCETVYYDVMEVLRKENVRLAFPVPVVQKPSGKSSE